MHPCALHWDPIVAECALTPQKKATNEVERQGKRTFNEKGVRMQKDYYNTIMCEYVYEWAAAPSERSRSHRTLGAAHGISRIK